MRLGEAKAKVEEPATTRLKLGGPKPQAKSGITLNLGQHRNSPTPGVSVDNEALARQRSMVQAGVNGNPSPAQSNPSLANGGAARPLSAAASHDPTRAMSSAHAASPPLAAVKNEKYAALSPAPGLAPSMSTMANGMMPPPLARPPSGSPHPSTNGFSLNTSYHFTAPGLLPPTPVRSYPVSHALLPTVTISTHPQLRIPKPFSLAIPPHDALSHQSTTITLPSTHYYLQIAPTISKELSAGRPYKMFVSVNGTRLTQRDTQYQGDSGKRTHLYEGSLAPGVNRIEIEVAAAKADGTVDTKGLDIEKVTVFAHLAKQTS